MADVAPLGAAGPGRPAVGRGLDVADDGHRAGGEDDQRPVAGDVHVHARGDVERPGAHHAHLGAAGLGRHGHAGRIAAAGVEHAVRGDGEVRRGVVE